jgi:hypothetical protein
LLSSTNHKATPHLLNLVDPSSLRLNVSVGDCGSTIVMDFTIQR